MCGVSNSLTSSPSLLPFGLPGLCFIEMKCPLPITFYHLTLCFWNTGFLQATASWHSDPSPLDTPASFPFLWATLSSSKPSQGPFCSQGCALSFIQTQGWPDTQRETFLGWGLHGCLRNWDQAAYMPLTSDGRGERTFMLKGSFFSSLVFEQFKHDLSLWK